MISLDVYDPKASMKAGHVLAAACDVCGWNFPLAKITGYAAYGTCQNQGLALRNAFSALASWCSSPVRELGLVGFGLADAKGQG